MSDESISAEESELAGKVREMLSVEDATSIAGSLGKLLKGMGVCLLLVVVLATFTAIFLAIIFDSPWISWVGWLFIYLVAVIGLAIWYERKTRKGYLNEAERLTEAAESSEPQAPPFSPIVMSLLWPARTMIDGFRGVRGLRTAMQHYTFDRGAFLVVDLAKSEGGIDIKKLVRPPEDMEIFGLAVDLLDTHAWIGKATDGKSLWLNSSFRKKYRVLQGR